MVIFKDTGKNLNKGYYYYYLAYMSIHLQCTLIDWVPAVTWAISALSLTHSATLQSILMSNTDIYEGNNTIHLTCLYEHAVVLL